MCEEAALGTKFNVEGSLAYNQIYVYNDPGWICIFCGIIGNTDETEASTLPVNKHVNIAEDKKASCSPC